MTSVPVDIRPCGPDDLPAITALWEQSGMHPFTEEMLARVDAMGGAALVAAEGAEVVGVVLWVHNGRQAFVWRLAVAGESRRSGIARALMRAAEASALAAGFDSMGLIVHRDNHAARALYERDGWRRSDTLETWWKRLPGGGADPDVHPDAL